MASISKRQQARNERQLQDLIRLVPGNSRCADCQALNPGWASWSLGVFLCMRCASIHRKLGTHISKIKSLSMDTWSIEQVEKMKLNGNIAVNKIYNPKNKQPDIPLDADEVDSAMERFIKKKYQEKSLSEGKPQPPSRDNTQAGLSVSPENSPPPPLPPKKGKFFGFGLRASSSAYPLSKHDKKNASREPRVDSAFRISSENFDQARRRPGSQREMSEEELQAKLTTLRDMGFKDDRRNATVLRGLSGNLERTIESLVRIQQVTKSTPENVTPTPTGPAPDQANPILSQATRPSTNLYGQSSTGQSFGLSFDTASQQPQTAIPPPAPDRNGTNPFDTQQRSDTDQVLQQHFQNMQISQPLFPHSTGGYPSQPPPMQDPRFQHSMTPPVPLFPQQYGYVASPTTMNSNTNPFFQSAQSSPVVSGNPYASSMQSSVPFATSSNPFFSQMTGAAGFQNPQPLQQLAQHTTFNPFGLPPANSASPPQQQAQPPVQQAFYDQGQSSFAPAQNFQQPYQPQFQTQQQPQPPPQPQHQNSFPNFQYGQPPPQQQYQSQTLPYSTQPQQQQQTLQPQRTGRIDKSSILALYNHPHLAPQPLASIPEPTEAQPQQDFTSQSPFPMSVAPQTQIQPGKRAVTMPAASGTSRNPFLNMSSAHSSGSSTPMPNNTGITARHASAESVSINNPALESGRHSPDAFASLSARYMR